MKVLVTGGAGFIGTNVIRELNAVASNFEVISLDNYSNGQESNLDNLSVSKIYGSVLDKDAVSDAAGSVDCVVHLAALGSVPRSVGDPITSHEVNVTGTLNVLEVARTRNIPHVIFASSSSVYGANSTSPKRIESWTGPASPYAASKLSAESYTLAYQHTYGLKVLAFRFFNVYGPFQSASGPYSAVIPRFIESALRDKPIEIHGDGLQVRDFTYVDDLAKVLVRSIQSQTSLTRPLNLAFGQGATVLDIVRIIERQLGTSLRVTFTSPRTGDVRTSLADPEQLRRLFPNISNTLIEDGLKKTLEWRLGARL